jgi:hypothetical protein
MTDTFCSTQSADPFADYRLLVELATDCFAAARFCPSEVEIGEEYAVAAGEELIRARAALAAAATNAAPPSEKTDSSKDARQRQRKPRAAAPGGLLLTGAQAAARLNCSIKTLNAHVDARDIRYVIIGKGTKRPRRYFNIADLDAFIAAQTREALPCPSTASRARRSGTSISGGEVIDFTAPRKPPTDDKRKK